MATRCFVAAVYQTGEWGEVGFNMVELLRTNDIVRLSFLGALLADAGIETVVFDSHTSVLEGSIGAIPRRLMVIGDDIDAARRVLDLAGESYGHD